MALSPSTGWQKYAELSINNPSIDYQMKLEIRRGSSQNNDPQQGIIYDDYNCCYDDLRDVRIGTSDDPAMAEQLPVWAEEVQNGIKRVLWIKTNGNALLYLFIGNSAADEYSDGNATFPYFDHWKSDNTIYWIYKNTGNNHRHWWENTKSFPYMKEIDMKGNILNWWVGPWDHTELGWTVDKTNWVHNVEHVLIYFEHRTTNGAVSDKISVKLHIRKGDVTTTTDLIYFTKPSSTDNLYLQLIYKTDEVRYIIKNLDTGVILAEDAITNASLIPNPENVKYLVTQQWDSAGGLFTWLSPDYLKWGSKQYNGGMEWKTDYWFIRLRTSVESTWSNFGTWQDVEEIQNIDVLEEATGIDEITTDKLLSLLELGAGLDEIAGHLILLIEELAAGIDKITKEGVIIISEIGNTTEIISIQGIEDKLSNLHVKPARVVTTHFPAVAGLPSDKKIRIYAKAVSGQEKEIILEAIT